MRDLTETIPLQVWPAPASPPAPRGEGTGNFVLSLSRLIAAATVFAHGNDTPQTLDKRIADVLNRLAVRGGAQQVA